jgi:hypothetical protein
MSTESFSERLTSIWHQGGRELAVTFLRRAVTLDNTLAELVAAFQFDGVKDHLGNIRLKDILAPQPRQAPAAQPSGMHTVVPERQKRGRRSSDEMRQLKSRLLGLLEQEAPGSLDTVQLMGVLRKDGHRVDTILVNGLLKTLEDEGCVSNLGGKPKAWRAAAHKAVAEPATIKKAHEAVSTEA